MITLYTYTTPNGRKISIMLEELGAPYQVKIVNLCKKQQFDCGFSAISPNNKIPAILDYAHENGPLAICESGAILAYLAEKHGRFLAPGGPQKIKVMEWLHWQAGELGPFFSNLGYFGVFAAEKMPVAIDRFRMESYRLLDVMEKRLATHAFLAGDDYSIADIATYPWTFSAGTFLSEFLGESIARKPAIQRWLHNIGERPAVKRGMAIPTLC